MKKLQRRSKLNIFCDKVNIGKKNAHEPKSASREHGAPGSAGEMAPWAPLTLRNDYAKAVAGMTYNKAYHI